MRSAAYLQMRDELAKEAREQKTPLFGHFELTARCNLDCKMCYIHNQNNSEYLGKELTTEQWKHIFDEAIECGMSFVSLSGGECLLRKDFKDIYLHLWNKQVFVTVLTNGTLLNDEYVEFFKTYPPDTIQISLYGSNENGYLNVTGHKGFEKALAAIIALEAAGIDVLVAVTASKYMKDDYLNILKLCKDYGFRVRNGEIQLVQNRDNQSKDDYFLTQEDIISLSIQRAELNKSVIPVENPPKTCGPMCEPPKNGLICSAGTCLVTVTWEGVMYPCYNAMVGGPSLLEMSFAEAWNVVVQATEKILLGVECVGCPYSKTCSKCPAFRLKDLHSGHCNPDMCELTRKLVAVGAKKLRQID